ALFSFHAHGAIFGGRMFRSLNLYSYLLVCLLLPAAGLAQSVGNAGSINGTVIDTTGAVVPGATVTIVNVVSQYTRTAITDDAGRFSFPNVPANPYHLSATAKGFSNYSQDVDVRSTVPISLKVPLTIGTSTETVTVEGTAGDLL